jgi:hypothetical protein
MTESTQSEAPAPLPTLLSFRFGLERSPTRDLCHYTSQEGLIGILKDKSLYATDASYLNDSQEVVYAVNLAKKYFKNRPSPGGTRPVTEMLNALDEIEDLAGKLPVYVASFSEHPDQLSQWRGYCSRGSGFALCVSADRITKIAKARNWELFKCIYREDQQVEVLKKIEDHAIRHFESDKSLSVPIVFGLILLGFGTALKHPKFAEESEWRAIRQSLGSLVTEPSIRPGVSTLTPYVNFPLTIDENDSVELSRLVVGPTPHAQLAVRAARSLLLQHKATCPEPVASDIPFRNW